MLQRARCESEKTNIFLPKKITPNWRPTCIRQQKLSIQMSCKSDKIYMVLTLKIWSVRPERIHYISVLLNPGWRHCIFASEKESRVCLIQITSVTESAVELNKAYHTSTTIFKIKRHTAKDGTWVFRLLFFSPNDCCESDRICNVFDNDHKLKKLNWWPTCFNLHASSN